MKKVPWKVGQKARTTVDQMVRSLAARKATVKVEQKEPYSVVQMA